MIVPYPHNLRGIVGVLLVLILLMIWVMYMNSRPKSGYTSLTTSVVFLKKGIEHYKFRNNEDFRYLKVQGYLYPFKIYVESHGKLPAPNVAVDSLAPGDVVTIYYYETDNTRETGMNRFMQFIDKEGKHVFKRSDLSYRVGIFTIGLCVVSIIIMIELYRRNKIPF